MVKFVKKLKNKKGFTLVELIVVIAIIAILTAVLIPVIGNFTAQANEAAQAQQIKEVETTINTVITDAGRKGSKIAVTSLALTISRAEGATTSTVALNPSSGVFTGGTYTDGNLSQDLGIMLAEAPAGTFTITFEALSNGDKVIKDITYAEAAAPAATT